MVWLFTYLISNSHRSLKYCVLPDFKGNMKNKFSMTTFHLYDVTNEVFGLSAAVVNRNIHISNTA